MANNLGSGPSKNIITIVVVVFVVLVVEVPLPARTNVLNEPMVAVWKA